MTSTTSTIRLASTFSGTSVFQNDAAFPAEKPEPLPTVVEVLVVGASFAGLGAAIELAVRGHNVLVLEAEGLGSDPFAAGLGRFNATLPPAIEASDELVAAATEADRWVKRVIREFSIPCGFDAKREPSDLDPFAFYRGVVAVAKKQGAKLRSNTRVVSVKRARGGGFDVKTGAGRLKAAQVVLAEASTVKTLVPAAPVHMADRTCAYLVTELVPEAVNIGSDPGLRVLDGRRVMASAEVPGSFSEARDELAARLFGSQPALQSAAADGAELKIENAWQLSYACSATGVPVAGEHDGIYFILPGSPDDLARMAWTGSRTARWMIGEAEPVFGVQPPVSTLTALVDALKALVKR